jgi:hypothetical protein
MFPDRAVSSIISLVCQKRGGDTDTRTDTEWHRQPGSRAVWSGVVSGCVSPCVRCRRVSAPGASTDPAQQDHPIGTGSERKGSSPARGGDLPGRPVTRWNVGVPQGNRSDLVYARLEVHLQIAAD